MKTDNPDRTDSKQEQSDHVDEWVARQPTERKEVALSIVIPAYNEQFRLPTTLISFIDYLERTSRDYEIIIVDDGSSDQTAEIARKFERIRKQIRLITIPINQGKGNAVRLGMINAVGKRVLFADADGATPMEEVERLEAALDRGADVAFGSRALRSEDTKVKALWHRRIIGRIFNFLVNALILPGVKDSQCGFKLFTPNAVQLFRRQTLNRWGFDVEILFLARKSNLKMEEVPVNWTNVPGSKVNLAVDSIGMFIDIILVRIRHLGKRSEKK